MITKTGCVNVTESVKRNTMSPTYEDNDGGNRNIVLVVTGPPHFNHEALTTSLDQPVARQSGQPSAHPDPANTRNNQNTELLTVSLAVVSLFLGVLLIVFSLLVFVFCRYNKRRDGGCERCLLTQRSLQSVDDSVVSTASSAALCSKHSGKGDLPSE